MEHDRHAQGRRRDHHRQRDEAAGAEDDLGTERAQGARGADETHGHVHGEVADVLPYTAKLADQIAVIRSMHTDQINHDPAHTVMNTGTSISGRPSMGSWLSYGLGSECDNMPAFVVLTSEGGRNPQPISSRMWGSGFLPGQHQGVMFQSKGDPVHYVRNPAGVTGRWLASTRFEVTVDGVRYPATVQLAPFYDPDRRRILA